MKYIGSVFFSLFFLILVSINVSASTQQLPKDNFEKTTAAMFSEEKEYNNHELIIKFRYSVTKAEKSGILQAKNLKEVDNLQGENVSLVSVPSGIDLEKLANELLKNAQIQYVEPNYKIETTFTPSDSGYKKQWYLKKITATKAWDETKGSSRVKVAVIDGGVQKDHPEFKGKIVDPYNMVTHSTSYTADEHGTHVAGIIAASNNKAGTVGVAPNVKIMPINVFQGSQANIFTIIDAIYYAIKHKADVINMSLVSYSYSSTLEEAVNDAKSNGIVVVAAAGNDDTYRYAYPSAFDSVIAVSATDSSDKITYFSNYGTYIDFSAPGENIYSTVPNKKYEAMDGTSMASPIVSGVSALVLSKNPFLSPSKVKDILKKSTSDLGRKGWDALYGNGRINAYKAVKYTTPAVKDLKASSTFTMKGTNKVSISFTPQSSTTINVYIENSKGDDIRKLITNKKSTGKKMSVSWDGKLDNGAYASNGSYKIVVKLSTSKKKYYKTKTIKVVNQVKPQITLYETKGEFSPNVKSISIPLKLNETAKVTAKIYDNVGKLVKTVWSDKSLTGGKKYNAEWNGKNSSGNLVPDGSYKVQFTVIDSSKLKGTTKSYILNVDSSAPSGTIANGVQTYIMDGNGKKVGDLIITEDVKATAYITTSTGTKMKKLFSDQATKAGTFEIAWDGKDDKKAFVAEGSYQLLVELKDSVGNKTTIKGGVFIVEDWTVPVVTSQKSMNFNLQGVLNIPYTLSKTGIVKLEIKRGDYAIYSKDVGTQTKGAYSFSWDGKDNYGNQVANGVYPFSIILRDGRQNGEFNGEIYVTR